MPCSCTQLIVIAMGILKAAHSSCFLLFLAMTSLISNMCVHADMNMPSDVYFVLMKGSPVVHYDGSLPQFAVAPRKSDGRADMSSEAAQLYASFLVDRHDSLINQALGEGAHLKKKVYSYHYLLNGFAAWLTAEEAESIRHVSPEIISVEKDSRVQKFTTYTPKYMGLPGGAWADNGGVEYAGEGIVIGIVDTGVNPSHPSFSDSWGSRPYSFPAHFSGICKVTEDFPAGSCNSKLVGARHFAAALTASGQFNVSEDSASPLDGDGHGTHTASTAAGNSGIPVIIDGMDFGLASGMAPRAHIAIYKSMFRNVGGYFSDTVAAMDQAVQDGVDILSLSIGPAEPPRGLATFFSLMEMAALSAVKAGVFVVQAAGNSGPLPGSIASYSPWIFTVGAAYHNRSYHNTILLNNDVSLKGFGLSPGTKSTHFYQLVLASDAAKKQREGSFLAYEGIINACQDSKVMEKEKVQGRILICRYTTDFLNGKASIHSVILTAKQLHACGVIVAVDRFTDGSDMGPFPSTIPIVLMPSLQESLLLLAYYNNTTAAGARIMGGLNATFNRRAPQVAFYSSRGPDLANDRRVVAEVMKPNAMAPGDMIWAAWSPIGNDDDDFLGANFALASGTSMAAPHVAGIAALVKQKNPNMSPAAIASALTTTASTSDHQGFPLLAQRPSYNLSIPLGPASPFDFGGGEVNPTAAIDPGLVFDAGFGEYVNFLCAIQGGEAEVTKATGLSCEGGGAAGAGHELNQPSLTVANLTEPRSFRRTATSVARHDETYTVSVQEPQGVSVSVTPTVFKMRRGSIDCRRRQGKSRCRLYTTSLERREGVELVIRLTPTSASSQASFGSILLTGSLGHTARLPLSVVARSLSVG